MASFNIHPDTVHLAVEGTDDFQIDADHDELTATFFLDCSQAEQLRDELIEALPLPEPENRPATEAQTKRLCDSCGQSQEKCPGVWPSVLSGGPYCKSFKANPENPPDADAEATARETDGEVVSYSGAVRTAMARERDGEASPVESDLEHAASKLADSIWTEFNAKRPATLGALLDFARAIQEEIRNG